MKKFLFATFACLLMVLASCTDSKLKALNEKIEGANAQTEFTQDEYSMMINYVNDHLEEAMKMNDEEVAEKLPYLPNFLSVAMYADMRGELNEDNQKLMDKMVEKLRAAIENEQQGLASPGAYEEMPDEVVEVVEEVVDTTMDADTANVSE